MSPITSSPSHPFAGFWRDLRFAARALLRRPVFAATVVATVALGVGANTAIFSVVDAALLRPLPYTAPERLVHLWERPTKGDARHFETSYPDFLDFQRRSTTLAAVAGYHTARVTLTRGDQTVVLPAAKVTANFFDVLGVTPAVGRRFAEGEDAVGAPRVAMLTHAFWRRALAADPTVVGNVVQLDGVPYTVVGVLPASFQFAASSGAEVWVPIDRPATMRAQRGNHWLRAIARLRPGASVDAAHRDADRVMRDLATEFPETNRDQATDVVPLHDEMVGSVRPVLLTLTAAVAFVLLVACGNVANLLLMHGAARHRELSVRAALGAGRGRIARQLLTESTLLALVGGVLGVAIAFVGIRVLDGAIPADQARTMPYLANVGVNGVVLGYALLLALLAGAASGIVPAPRVAGADLHAVLRQRGGAGSTQGRLRDGLVVAELALTVVLLSGAALFGKSLTRLLAVDTGFRGDGVLTTMVPLPRWQYTTEGAQRRFYLELEQRVAALPGVSSVGLVSKLPLDAGNSTSYTVEGEPPSPDDRGASYRVANAEYFRTLGIPLLRGRTFALTDDSAATGVAIINQAMAREAFGDRDPIGRRLGVGSRSLTVVGVVGVVGDVTIGKLEDAVPPTMYFSYRQSMDVAMRLAVRTRMSPDALASTIRAVVHAIDPAVSTYQARTMTSVVAESPSVFLRRYPLFLIGAFAAVALLLALIGTYGVISYAVSQRLRELGIRLALGARPGAVRWLVLRHAGSLALLGAAIGIGAAIVLGRLASGLLFGVSAADPIVLLAVAATLGLMALAAALLPARRATRVDPAIVLGAE